MKCSCGNEADTTLYRSQRAQARDQKPARESVCQSCAIAAGGSVPVRVPSGRDPIISASGKPFDPFWE